VNDKQKLAKAARGAKAFRCYLYQWAPESVLDEFDKLFSWLTPPKMKAKWGSKPRKLHD
jgi:hypothetical protein